MEILLSLIILAWCGFIVYSNSKKADYKRLEEKYENLAKENCELQEKLDYLDKNPGKKLIDYYDWQYLKEEKEKKKEKAREKYIETLNEEQKDAFFKTEEAHRIEKELFEQKKY